MIICYLTEIQIKVDILFFSVAVFCLLLNLDTLKQGSSQGPSMDFNMDDAKMGALLLV